MVPSRRSKHEIKIWSPHRLRVASFVEDKRFDVAMGIAILANSVVLVVETNQRAQCEDPNSDKCDDDLHLYSIIGSSFLSIYVIELLMKFFAYRLAFFQSTWNNFDFLVVAISILSEVLGGIIPGISVARVFRAARLAKVFRVLMVYKELYMIIFGFASAMRTIVWASMLLFFLLTIWSIFAVELLHPVNKELAKQGALAGCDRCHRAFESVWASNLTFLQTIISGDSWGKYAIPIIEQRPQLVLLFIGVWSTVVVGFGNLILAVIVECANEAREDDLVYQERVKLLGEEAAMQQFLKMCKEMDSQQTGQLQYNDFVDCYNDSAELAKMLKVMNIQEADLPMLFAIMDEDGSGGIDYHEFANTIHKMRSSEAYLNFTFIKHEIRAMKEQTEKQIKAVQAEVSSLASLMRGSKHVEHIAVDPAKTMQAKGVPSCPFPNFGLPSCEAVLEELYQHDVKLKMEEIGLSVKLLVSKTLESPSNGEFDSSPLQLLSHPQNHVKLTGNVSGSDQPTVLSKLLRTSPGKLPQIPLCGGPCSNITVGQPTKIRHSTQDTSASAAAQQ